LKKGSKGVLVDTCIWIDFFRGDSDTGNILESLLQKDVVYTAGPILFELMQGIKSDREKANIISEVGGLHYREMTQALWLKAGELSSTLRSTGSLIPISDILIAVLAMEHNVQVFTVDKHFERIPGIDLFG
jgi:predicted nucleic acid-binding protein